MYDYLEVRVWGLDGSDIYDDLCLVYPTRSQVYAGQTSS